MHYHVQVSGNKRVVLYFHVLSRIQRNIPNPRLGDVLCFSVGMGSDRGRSRRGGIGLGTYPRTGVYGVLEFVFRTSIVGQ